MSVKIDSSRQPGDADAAKRLETSQRTDRTDRSDKAARAPEGKSTTPTDRVEVSKDAQLLTAALKAASAAPEIRVDAVERAQKALESGQLGNDTLKLADRMIDDLVKGS